MLRKHLRLVMLGWITTRLQLDDAVTRQAQILEPSITAKRWNSRMRAESRRQENMQHRGSSDSRATADSHCEIQGSRNEVKSHGNAPAEMSFNLGR